MKQQLFDKNNNRKQQHLESGFASVTLVLIALLVLLGVGIYEGLSYVNSKASSSIVPTMHPIQATIQRTTGTTTSNNITSKKRLDTNSTVTTNNPNSNSNNGEQSGIVTSGNTGINTTNGNKTSGTGSANGTVTAISATSITIQPNGGNPETFAITSSTSIANPKEEQFGNPNAGQASYSDIHTGDTVVVTPDKDNPGNAIGILINP